jgi:hypothetical protein
MSSIKIPYTTFGGEDGGTVGYEFDLSGLTIRQVSDLTIDGLARQANLLHIPLRELLKGLIETSP